jgi:hypothetical protein
MKLIIQNFTVLLILVLFPGLNAGENKPSHEYYEHRVYKITSAENRVKVLNYLDKVYVPALKRAGIKRVGVLVNAEIQTKKKKGKKSAGPDHSIHVILSFVSANQYASLSEVLGKDATYQTASSEHFTEAKKAAIYTRIDSSFYKSFTGMPFMELPQQTVNKTERLFELRMYESHNEGRAALKRDMFNAGKETQLMRDTKLGPVFFGECLSGRSYPNLLYMVCSSNIKENKAHWKTFMTSPEWNEMKNLKKYKETVSNIEMTYLKPVSFSDI